jgi:hypothetical protein
MKTRILAGLALLMLALTSCETTKEITINADGSGEYSTSLDMSALIGMAKMSGGEGMEELGDKKVDTMMSIKTIIDSLDGISPEDKALAGKGSLQLKMDMDNDIFKTKVSFPFSNLDELVRVDKISGKASTNAMMTAMSAGKEKMGDMGDMGMPEGTIDDYFTMSFTENSISKKLNAEKYAKIDEDEGMQAMKEMAGQGMTPSNTVIIKLPRPVKKAEGKGITVSEDKKTITIKESAEDFLEDGKSFEFLIEY